MLRTCFKGVIHPKEIYNSIFLIFKKIIIAAACGRFSSELAVIRVRVLQNMN